MQALKVTFKLASPLFLDSEYPVHLDALLAYACVQEMQDAGEDDCWAKTDSALGELLERSHGDAVGDPWVWKASKLFVQAASSIQFANQIRKSDPEMYFEDLHSDANPSGVWVTGFMKDGTARKFNPETFGINTASGQQRGYQWLAASRWVKEVTAFAVGDVDLIREYLTRHIRNLGKVGRNGFGRVASIEVAAHDGEDDWRLRVLPVGMAGKEGAGYAQVQACLRAPYWRKTDRVLAMEPIL